MRGGLEQSQGREQVFQLRIRAAGCRRWVEMHTAHSSSQGCKFASLFVNRRTDRRVFKPKPVFITIRPAVRKVAS